MPTIKRGVNSNNPTLIKEFCKHAIAASQEANIYGRIHQLLTKEHFSPSDHDDLEQIDVELTKLLVSADQQCKKPGTHPWSPELHKAYIIHHYWTLKLSSQRTGRQYPQALTKIENQFTITQLKLSPTDSISAHLRAAQSQLRDIKKKADDKRKTHLEDLIQAAAITQDKRRKRLITCLKRAEELRHCYSLVRSITKPRQQGGLSHVNIPKETTPPAPPQWNAIYDPQELK